MSMRGLRKSVRTPVSLDLAGLPYWADHLIRVAAVRRLVDRGIEEAGAPEGSLRTATIKYRCKYLSDGHLCDFNYHQATKPDH
ncbi:hypothetical protein PS922_02343 [Pseudomonas fluorescens]|uniref:Uncharacterized protein n=1 Tax=Pseudomonas fluorescens TaxID=294 RepID=A0A5E7SKZ4_PSEFL|nr:hypothetical protein PS922_02343 [Pseudomonas fluorescens]